MEKIGELAQAVAAQHFPADAAEGIEVGGWGVLDGLAGGLAAALRVGLTSPPATYLTSRHSPVHSTAPPHLPIPRTAPHPPHPTPALQFAVQYDARAAPPLDRMEVINAFANCIQASRRRLLAQQSLPGRPQGHVPSAHD